MSFNSSNLRCYNCKFWWPLPEPGQHERPEKSARGSCRRHAPPGLLTEEEHPAPRYAAWVIVSRDDWCGEHVHLEM